MLDGRSIVPPRLDCCDITEVKGAGEQREEPRSSPKNCGRGGTSPPPRLQRDEEVVQARQAEPSTTNEATASQEAAAPSEPLPETSARGRGRTAARGYGREKCW